MSISVLFSEFMELMNPTSIFNAFWATGFGIIVGMLPGLTATMGVALLTGLTFRFMPEQAMVVLISTYVGSIYGAAGRPFCSTYRERPPTPPPASTATPSPAGARPGTPSALPPPPRGSAPSSAWSALPSSRPSWEKSPSSSARGSSSSSPSSASSSAATSPPPKTP